MADKPEVSKTHLLTEKFLEQWKEAEPEFPFGVVGALIEKVIDEHPNLLMVTNYQAEQILGEARITLPDGISIGEIAGKANPGIIRVRTKLRGE